MAILPSTQCALGMLLVISMAVHADIEGGVDSPPVPIESYSTSDSSQWESVGDAPEIPIQDRGYGAEQVQGTWDWIRALIGIDTEQEIK